MEQPIQQLEMVRSGSNPPAVPAVLDGYLFRQFREADRASYWHLFAQVFRTHSRLDNLRTAALPGGFFVIEHERNGDVVASAVAAEYEKVGHTERGSLQWVMTDPLHVGKGLGKAVVAAATGRLALAGYIRAYLSTDDWRLPAIHVYLTLGWKPLLYAPDMQERWKAVFKQLGRDPANYQFVNEPRQL